jgi:hypothetical protein
MSRARHDGFSACSAGRFDNAIILSGDDTAVGNVH